MVTVFHMFYLVFELHFSMDGSQPFIVVLWALEMNWMRAVWHEWQGEQRWKGWVYTKREKVFFFSAHSHPFTFRVRGFCVRSLRAKAMYSLTVSRISLYYNQSGHQINCTPNLLTVFSLIKRRTKNPATRHHFFSPKERVLCKTSIIKQVWSREWQQTYDSSFNINVFHHARVIVLRKKTKTVADLILYGWCLIFLLV